MTGGVIDEKAIARLLEVVGGDPEFLEELFDEFDKVAPELVESMTKAAAVGDFNGLRISAHTLKSNSREFGAYALGALCESLEHACRDLTVADADARIVAIGRELETTRSALAGLRSGNA